MSERDRRTNYRSSKGDYGKNERSRTGGYGGQRDRYKEGYQKRSGPSRHSRSFTLRKGTQVFVLDILQHGGIDKPGHSWQPICQIMEVPSFQFFEIELNKGQILQIQDKIIISESGPLGRVKRRLNFSQLSITSSDMIKSVLEQYISEDEKRFIEFINNAAPITIKRHSLEILPGVGKKLMWEIVKAREIKPFESFQDLHTRVPGFKPVEVFAKEILEELSSEDLKHYLFIKKRRRTEDQPTQRDSPKPSYSRRY